MKEKSNVMILLCVIFIVGTILRGVILFHHLPDMPHIDENVTNAIVEKLAQNRFNTGDVITPSVFYYMLYVLYSVSDVFLTNICIHIFSWHAGICHVLFGRIFVCVLSLITIPAIYYLGKKVFNTTVGLYAALFLAINPLHVRLSAIVKPMNVMVLFLVLGFIFIYRLFEKKDITFRDYLFCGVMLGFVASVLYYGLSLYASFAAVIMLKRERLTNSRGRGFLLTCGAGLMVFVLLNPYIVLNFGRINELTHYEFISNITGSSWNPIANNIGWINYILALPSTFGIGVLVLSLIGIVYSSIVYNKKAMILLSSPIAFYFVMGALRNSPPRHLCVILPSIILFAALAIDLIIAKGCDLVIRKQM